MDLLQSALSFCRAIWTEPLPYESGAPRRRIIHSREVRATTSMRLDRLGLRVGLGYFKCGSDPQTDWVTDFRVLVLGRDHGSNGWIVAREEHDVPAPDDESTITWFDLGGIEAIAVLVELRRCNVDDWWPSWNLAQGGMILEGEPVGAATQPPREGALALADWNLSDLPTGIQAERLPGEVRYRTRFLEVGFRLRRAGFAYLALDDEGQQHTGYNLLQLGNLGMFHQPAREYLVHGPRLWSISQPAAASFFAHAVEGTTRVSGNTVTYDVSLSDTGQTYRLRWEVQEDRLLLTAERSGNQLLRAWNSSAWHVAFDSRVTPTTTLGRITKQGETGIVALPVALHGPRFGTFRISASGEAIWRADSIRPIFTTTNELKIGEIPQAEGDYLLLPGKHRAELEWVVESPVLVRVNRTAPREAERFLRRCAITGLTYRPDTATFSNNGNSMHGIICADNWSAIATRMGEIVPGLRATALLRDTIERWLDGGQGYASGWSSHSRHLFEDEYVMSGTAALLGLAEFVRSAADAGWLAHYAAAIKQELGRMRARDLDDDGLVESAYRLGISGQHQWSTCWYDVISFGWKDAFSNALLYPALRILADELPRLGQTGLAEGLAEWSDRLRKSYSETFLNPKTGWFGGWRSKDGQLHDHAFLFVNGAAVNGGMVGDTLAKEIMRKLWSELQRAGFNDFRLGLPGNVWKIPDQDMGTMQHGLPLGTYQNGGATHSQARHFVSALYKVGMRDEADQILLGLCASMGDGTAFGGCASGVDWRMWDGSPSGYEGLLCDQFGVLAPAIDRFV